MADQIHLRLGAQPWRPADTARPVKILNHYDIPLAGIVRQHGAFYLFECLAGEVQSVNLWAYVPISRKTARRLKRLTTDRLVAAMHAEYVDRAITVALAVNGSISMGECVEVRQSQAPRAEALRAVQKKAEQDSSAVAGLTAMA